MDDEEILVFVLDKIFATLVIKSLLLNTILHNSMYIAFLLSLFCALQMSRHVRGIQFCAINFSVRRWKKERVVHTVIYCCQSVCNMVLISHILLPGYLTKIYVKVQVFWYVISCFGFRVTEVPKKTMNSKAWRNIPGGLNIQQHHCQNVRFHIKYTVPLHALYLPNKSDSFYKC